MPPERFNFDKNHGYHVIRRMMKAILTGVFTMTRVTYYQYPHGMVLNKDITLSKAIPHFHFIFKASKTMTQTLQHFKKLL